MLSLQDRVRVHGCCSVKPMVWKFFGKISEGGNFRNFFENSENSEKYPLPKNTRFTVTDVHPWLVLAASRPQFVYLLHKRSSWGYRILVQIFCWWYNAENQKRWRPHKTKTTRMYRFNIFGVKVRLLDINGSPRMNLWSIFIPNFIYKLY